MIRRVCKPQVVLFIALLSISGCSKSGTQKVSNVSPADVAVINDSLKDHRFIKEHFEDPERVQSFLAKLVALCCNRSYQVIASGATLKRMERSGLSAWLRAGEKSEVVLRGLLTDPKVMLEGNKWKVEFNVFRRNGGVEKWDVAGKNDPEREYNQIDKIEITTLKSKGTFSWPMI